MATDRSNGSSGPASVARPGVLSLNIREKAALYAAYMPFLAGGGIFIPTNRVQGNRTQGIGVQFTRDETGAAARATIEKILGETLASNRPTHTM